MQLPKSLSRVSHLAEGFRSDDWRDSLPLWVSAGLVLVGISVVSCNRDPNAALAAQGISPVYNAETGKLEQLLSDRDGDGKKETRAFMDGTTIKYIEIDRDYDERFDRWEYYVAAPGSVGASRSPDGRSVLDHAEEAGGPDERITRWEFYVDGVLARVEEDTDADGRVDKWELFEAGALKRMDIDLEHAGRPTRRLHYGPNGEVTRVESDSDGDGVFEPVPDAGRGGGS